MWQIGAILGITDNPELGPGRVRGRDANGTLFIRFPWRSTEGHFDPRRTPIERYKLFGDVPVQCKLHGVEDPVLGVVLGGLDQEEGAQLLSYRVGFIAGDDLREVTVPESDLFPLPAASHAPLDILKALSWQGPTRFFRRWRMHLLESRWIEDSGGIPAFLGARIQPMGHQLYAARRVLWDRVPRFILADEVGLGKTIEAGLVIQALRAEKPDLSLLIVAPGSMARQWQMELYLRFGAHACVHLDSVTFAESSATARKRLLDSLSLVATTTVLQRFPETATRLAQRHWDLVVVDEAHQFPPGCDLYDFFHRLARQSLGFLALSATPSKREITSLAGLLALVAPDVYEPTDEAGLSRRLAAQREVWDRLSFTRKYLDAVVAEGRSLQADDFEFLAEEWEGLLDSDPMAMALIDDLKREDPEAPDKLVAYVQEFHRLDHRIIRTRRSSLQRARQHWSERRVQRLDYEPDTYEAVLANHLDELPLPEAPTPAQLALRGLYYRHFSSSPNRLVQVLETRSAAMAESRNATPEDPLSLLTADPGPADEELLLLEILQSTTPFTGETAWLDTALGLARSWREHAPVCRRMVRVCDWLEEHLGQHPANQVLLFAQDRPVVEELGAVIQTQLPGISVQMFHHGMDEADLAHTALQFQRNQDCRILVSDELGGEGRNFQNAGAVLHFDLPWSVARLEQRIGRLDRVGRGADRPVESVVVLGPMAVESALYDIHDQVFRVFTRSVGGLEYALPRMQRDLNEALCRGRDALDALVASLSEQVRQELEEVDEAFELSLDASKHQLGSAEELAEWLSDSGNDPEAAITLAKWAGRLGIATRVRADETSDFRWTADSLLRHPSGLRTEGFISGTFSRQRALDDESQQFLSPGHPLVDALMEDMETSAEGRACVMAMQLGASYRGRLFALVLVRSDLDEQRFSDDRLPHGLRLRARRFHLPEVQVALMELHPGDEPAAVIVDDPDLLRLLRNPNHIEPRYHKVGPNSLGTNLDTLSLWAAVEEALPLAVEHVREQRKGIPEEGASQLADDLRQEIGFLTWKRSRQPDGEREALDAEIAARLALVDSVRHEYLGVEAVAVIIALA